MNLRLTYLSSVFTIILISGLTHIAFSMDDQNESQKPSFLLPLKEIAALNISNLKSVVAGEKPVTPSKLRTFPYPKEFSFSHLKAMFGIGERNEVKISRSDGLQPISRTALEIDIDGSKVRIYVEPKTLKKKEICKMLADCETEGKGIIAKHIEYQGNAYTLAATAVDTSIHALYMLYYENDDKQPISADNYSRQEPYQLIVSCSAESKDLPMVISSPSGLSASEKSSSVPMPLKLLNNNQLRDIFNTKVAVPIGEGKHKVDLIDDAKKNVIAKKLNSRKGDKYTAEFVRFVGDSTISNTFSTQGAQKQLCEYKLVKKGFIFKSNAQAPKGTLIENPKKFHEFIIAVYK